MKKSKSIFLQLIPLFVVAVAIIFGGLTAYVFAPKSHVADEDNVVVLPQVEIIPSPQPHAASSTNPKPKAIASPKSTPSTNPGVVAIAGKTVSTPTLSVTPSPNPTNTASPTAIPTQSVNIEIKTPDSSSSFSVEISEGMNVCEVMQKAKDEAKIQTISFDDSYLSVYKSRYISEINGLKNNWTFKVNGESPLGCSLKNLKPNDLLVWTFG